MTTYSPRVPRLPSPKPYAPRSHPVAIIGGGVPVVLTPGLHVQPAPRLPRGFQIKCSSCRCTVDRNHRPDSDECMQDRLEREWSVSS